MPIAFEVRGVVHRLDVRGWGRVTDADLAAHVESYRNHPDFDPSFDELIDLSEVSGADVTVPGLRRIADEMRQRDPALAPVRVAIVAPTDVVFGLSRLYQTHRGGPDDVQVFRDRGEAEAWLSQPPEGESGP